MDVAQAAILLTAGPSLLSLLSKPPFPNLEHKKAEQEGLEESLEFSRAVRTSSIKINNKCSAPKTAFPLS